MDCIMLIKKWRKRRQEILDTLPPALLKEYRQLSKKIKMLMDEEMSGANDPGPFSTPQRTPLWQHKKTLIEYLKKMSPVITEVSRQRIHMETEIPMGTLSLLLREKEFEQVRHGFWGLRKSK
jgi:hypothetical protein